MNIRRYYVENAVYFITCVTFQRKKIFKEKENIDLFWETYRITKEMFRFKRFAYALMYDHFHFLIQPLRYDISLIMKSLKYNYTMKYKKHYSKKDTVKLWQTRFWDRIIRDDREFEKYFHYIHFNPVKHGIVNKPEEYKESSYNYWLEKDYYNIGWGHSPIEELKGMEFE